MDSPDFAWAVMAIRIQREVGGNLAELLMTVADTMIQRERLRRDVKALTAEGRMSAIVLGLLPIASSASRCSSSTRLHDGLVRHDQSGQLLILGGSVLAGSSASSG